MARISRMWIFPCHLCHLWLKFQRGDSGGSSIRSILLPALLPETVRGDAALSTARHAVRGSVFARARLGRSLVRRDAGRVGAGGGRRARPAYTAPLPPL